MFPVAGSVANETMEKTLLLYIYSQRVKGMDVLSKI
jgi:hypothetical protein